MARRQKAMVCGKILAMWMLKIQKKLTLRNHAVVRLRVKNCDLMSTQYHGKCALGPVRSLHVHGHVRSSGPLEFGIARPRVRSPGLQMFKRQFIRRSSLGNGSMFIYNILANRKHVDGKPSKHPALALQPAGCRQVLFNIR